MPETKEQREQREQRQREHAEKKKEAEKRAVDLILQKIEERREKRKK